MRVNVYAEEMTDRLEIIHKEIDGHDFTGLRFYPELPATVDGKQYQAPFVHRPGDDDSSAVTFWGKRDLRAVLRQALAKLDEHYEKRAAAKCPRCHGTKSVCSRCEEYSPTCKCREDSGYPALADCPLCVGVGLPVTLAAVTLGRHHPDCRAADCTGCI